MQIAERVRWSAAAATEDGIVKSRDTKGVLYDAEISKNATPSFWPKTVDFRPEEFLALLRECYVWFRVQRLVYIHIHTLDVGSGVWRVGIAPSKGEGANGNIQKEPLKKFK